MQVTLEEQIKGLRSVCTSSAEQFRARTAAIDTLTKLKTLRDGLASGSQDTDKLVAALIESCGLRP